MGRNTRIFWGTCLGTFALVGLALAIFVAGVYVLHALLIG